MQDVHPIYISLIEGNKNLKLSRGAFKRFFFTFFVLGGCVRTSTAGTKTTRLCSPFQLATSPRFEVNHNPERGPCTYFVYSLYWKLALYHGVWGQCGVKCRRQLIVVKTCMASVLYRTSLLGNVSTVGTFPGNERIVRFL